MSLNVSSTASNSSTSLTTSTSGASPVTADNTESRFSCLHDVIGKCLSSLDTINPNEFENPNELEMTKKSVCENFTLLYLNTIESICNDFKREVNSGEELNSLARDGYSNSINKVTEKRVALEQDFEELEEVFNEDLEKIQTVFTKEAAESFKNRISTEIRSALQELETGYREKIDNLVEKALRVFYISTLDSYPKLHSDFKGFSNTAIAQHYSQDIVFFLDENNKLNNDYKEVLLDCSSKLQEAYSFETMRKRCYKKQDKDSLADHAKTMEFKIKSLQVGESCLFLGGTGSHAVIYEVIRKSANCCEFTIINTGDDEDGAKNRKPNHYSRIFMDADQYCHKSYLVSPAVLNSEFLLKLIDPMDQFVAMGDVVGEIDKHLKANRAQFQLGRLHRFQERGSCAAKSPASWFKGELIRKFGVEKGKALYLQFKHFRAEKNYKAILKLENEVPRDHFRNAYSERVYKEGKNRYEPREVIKKMPATESKLKKCLTELHTTAAQVIHTWGEKAQKAKANL